VKILIIRTSAMGDVALLTPVLKSLRRQYPDIDVVLLTRKAFLSLFYSYEEIKLFPADFDKKHKGFSGIFKLWYDLRKEHKINYVIDLHNVLRSKILRSIFRISGIPVKWIRKGRKEKRDILSGKNKVQLAHVIDRYYDVFTRAGFPMEKTEGPWIVPSREGIMKSEKLFAEKGPVNIGVAPFAKHHLKIWPADFMIKLLELIAGYMDARFWLFGGKEEIPRLKLIQERIPEAKLVAGNMSLDEELAIISRLSFVISMDSANMHMAALSDTKVFSIWGATDPLTGFGAWQQPDEYAIRIPVEELTCRPCTVYGKGKCKRGDFACMMWLTPERIFKCLNNLKII